MLTLPASLPEHKSVWKRDSSPQVSSALPGGGGGKSKFPQVVPRYPWASVPPSGH